jgi:hypothetical protein
LAAWISTSGFATYQPGDWSIALQIPRKYFSEEQFIELSAQIAFENYRARWNQVIDIGSDEIYKPRAVPD